MSGDPWQAIGHEPTSGTHAADARAHAADARQSSQTSMGHAADAASHSENARMTGGFVAGLVQTATDAADQAGQAVAHAHDMAEELRGAMAEVRRILDEAKSLLISVHEMSAPRRLTIERDGEGMISGAVSRVELQ